MPRMKTGSSRGPMMASWPSPPETGGGCRSCAGERPTFGGDDGRRNPCCRTDQLRRKRRQGWRCWPVSTMIPVWIPFAVGVAVVVAAGGGGGVSSVDVDASMRRDLAAASWTCRREIASSCPSSSCCCWTATCSRNWAMMKTRTELPTRKPHDLRVVLTADPEQPERWSR